MSDEIDFWTPPIFQIILFDVMYVRFSSNWVKDKRAGV